MSDAPAVPDEQVLHFPEGIPGFSDSRRFALVELGEDSAFQVLQSLDEPDVSMVVSVPWIFFPDYAPVIDDADQRDLEIESPDDAVLFCTVTLDESGDEVFLNLLGPFVVNTATRRGRQVVLADASQPVRALVSLAG